MVEISIRRNLPLIHFHCKLLNIFLVVHYTQFLPSTTYYQLKDIVTGEVVVPFNDNYTKVSCDSTSNFIYLDMTGLMPERYYRLEFKIVDGFLDEYINDKLFFKVTR